MRRPGNDKLAAGNAELRADYTRMLTKITAMYEAATTRDDEIKFLRSALMAALAKLTEVQS